jgi:hypothetical protein
METALTSSQMAINTLDSIAMEIPTASVNISGPMGMFIQVSSSMG